MFGGLNDTCRKLRLLEVALWAGGGSSTWSGAGAESEAGRRRGEGVQGCLGAGAPGSAGFLPPHQDRGGVALSPSVPSGVE